MNPGNMTKEMKAYRKKMSEQFDAQTSILTNGLDRPS